MTACVRGQKSRGVFAFSFTRLRRTTAKPVERNRAIRADDTFGTDTTERDGERKRVRIARSRPRAWGGIERRSPRRAVRRERDLRFRDRRASLFRDAPSRTTRTEVVAHVARPSHAENGQVTAQVARVAQLAALQARLEHRKPFARKDAFTKRVGRSTSRRRTARVRPEAWEAREALPRPVRHGTRIDRPTPFAPRATTANERLETWSRTCMGKQSESCSARNFERTRRRSFAWKKVGVHIGVPSGDALRRAGLPTSGAGFRAFRAYAGTVRVARRSRLERTSSLRRVRGTSSTERPQGTPPPPPPRCRAPALTPCSARRRRSS